MSMIGTSRTIGSEGGRLGDIGYKSGRGMYSDKGAGSKIGSISCMTSCPGATGEGHRNVGGSAGVGTRGLSAKLLR